MLLCGLQKSGMFHKCIWLKAVEVDLKILNFLTHDLVLMMPKCFNKYIYPSHCNFKKSWTKKNWQTNTSETRGFPTFWRPPAKQSLVQSYWPLGSGEVHPDDFLPFSARGGYGYRFDDRGGPVKLQGIF